MKLALKVLEAHNITEGSVKGLKIDYAKAKQELVSTAFHFIDGLRERKISFEYDSDKASGKILLKNMEVGFDTGGESIWLSLFSDSNFKGALTALNVVEKIVELDNFASKAK
jgi:hypothetical protein